MSKIKLCIFPPGRLLRLLTALLTEYPRVPLPTCQGIVTHLPLTASSGLSLPPFRVRPRFAHTGRLPKLRLLTCLPDLWFSRAAQPLYLKNAARKPAVALQHLLNKVWFPRRTSLPVTSANSSSLHHALLCPAAHQLMGS